MLRACEAGTAPEAKGVGTTEAELGKAPTEQQEAQALQLCMLA